MKRRKRAVVTTLLFSILLTVIPVGDNGQSMMQQCTTADSVTGQKSVSASEYLNDTTALTASVITISNADDLRAFKKILQKESMKGKTVVQTEDIALSKYTYRYVDSSLYDHRIGIYDGDTLQCTVDAEGKVHQPLNSDRITSWKACGVTDDFVWTNSDLKTFQGVYQGNHHVISGALFCENSAGLFSSLEGAVVNLRMEHCASIANIMFQAIVVGESSGTVSNCSVSDSVVVSANTNAYTGAIAGFANLNSVISYNTSENNRIMSDGQAAGGIVGQSYVSVRDCLVNGGAVSGENCTGGIVGIVASTEGIFIHGCQSSANISGKYVIGGICGFYAQYTSIEQSAPLTISECTNRGNLTEQAVSDYGVEQHLGGILANAQGAVTITKCHNSGDVLSDQETCNASEVNLGGIMGGIYNPEKWECKISDTDNTGHITGKQHSISRIGGIIADGGWPNLTLQNTANYGKLQYAVNDDYAEAEIGGILGQGCEAEESEKNTWNALQKHVIANSINYGEIQIGSEQNYRAVTVGGLAGKAEADRWQYCYEASGMQIPLYGKDGNGSKKEVFAVSAAQRDGDETVSAISENTSSYAYTVSLLTALNNFVTAQNAAGSKYLTWIQGKNKYPVLYGIMDMAKSGYSVERLIDAESVRPKPSATPTSSPTKTPTANPSVTPSVAPNIRPTANPSVTPSVAPNIRPTAVPTKRPTVVPTKRPATPAKHPCKPTIAPKKYPAPRVKVVRKKTKAGQRYIQVSLRKKQNCYLQFYRKTAKGFRQIKLMNNYLQRGHRKINIAYSRKMKTVTYKIRIYKKVNGRRKYSKFTKVKKMRLS